MIDCQLITYINYCLTHYPMSNLLAKAKADAEARAAAEADLSAKMKAQQSDLYLTTAVKRKMTPKTLLLR